MQIASKMKYETNKLRRVSNDLLSKISLSHPSKSNKALLILIVYHSLKILRNKLPLEGQHYGGIVERI